MFEFFNFARKRGLSFESDRSPPTSWKPKGLPDSLFSKARELSILEPNNTEELLAPKLPGPTDRVPSAPDHLLTRENIMSTPLDIQTPPVGRSTYSQTFWEHVRQPHNRRALPDATSVGESRYPRCGDRLTLYLDITDDRIAEASFEARACAPVIAVASLGVQRITGLTLNEARELSILELDRELGGLPPSKRHAYLIFLESLHCALHQSHAKE
jgi:NifU-like protein involved in Fe-S cluster formation